MASGYLRISFSAAVLAALQSIAAPVISTVVLVISTFVLGVEFSDAYIALSVISALLVYMFLRGQMTQDQGAFISAWTMLTRVAIAWLGAIMVLLLIGYASKVSAEFSRRALFSWFLVTPPLLAGTLLLLRQWYRRILARSGNTRSVVLVGVNDVSRELARSIGDGAELGMEVKGFFDDRGPERLGDMDSVKLLGPMSELAAYAKQERIDTIFIVIPLSYMQRTKDLLVELQDTTSSIYFVPDIFVFDLIQARSDDLNGIPVVALCETPFNGWQGLTKRATDLVMATLMLVLAAPVMILIALCIKLSSPGSIIFRQSRYGLDGEEIIIYKFRSMTVTEDSETVRQVTKDDARVTRLGRFLRRYSLDELPQLVNVLQGRMSVVGPRPHAVAHNEQYRKLIGGYMVRHKVAPGITGLAQVNGFRGETATVEDMKRRVDYDLEYLRRWSLALDLKILLRTFAIWFRDEKAY